MAIITQHNQSLLDVAIQQYGDASAAFELAAVNGVALDVVPQAGDALKELEVTELNAIANYYTARGIVPATGVIPRDQFVFAIGVFEPNVFD